MNLMYVMELLKQSTIYMTHKLDQFSMKVHFINESEAKRLIQMLTLHKNVSTGIADMLEMVAFSGQMLDA